MKNNFSKQWDAGGGSRSIIQSLNLFTSRNLFKSLKSILMVVALLSLSSNVWGAEYSTGTLPTKGWTTSGGTQTLNNVSWTYASSTYIGVSSNKIQVGSKNSPQTSAWTFQTAVSNFGTNKKITSVAITAYTTATTATYDISVNGTSVKSGNLTTSSATYTASNLNYTSGNIVITLQGSSTSKAMYLGTVTVTYEDAASADTWSLAGGMNGWSTTANPLTGTTTLSTTCDLTAGTTTEFKIVKNGSIWYGNSGTMTRANCSGWEFFNSNNDNAKITADKTGTYTFNVTINGSGNPVLSVVYPADTWQLAGFNDWSHPIDFVNGSCQVTLTAKEYTYDTDAGFKLIKNGEVYYGCNGTMTRSNCTNWTFYTGDGNKNCGITADVAGTYTFTINTSSADPQLSVTYPTKYTVTYNGNGNTTGSAPAAADYAKGATVTVAGNTGSLAKTGYDFGGWNTNASGTGTNYTAGSGTFTISANTTLYAKWNIKSYAVTKGTVTGGSATVPSSVNHGADVTLTNLTPDANHKLPYTITVSGNYGSIEGATIKNVTGAITVNVSFAEKAAYTVTYYNGTTQVDTKQVAEGNPIGALNTGSTLSPLSITNTRFMGWTETPFDGKTTTRPTLVDASTVVNAAMDLYAVWGYTSTNYAWLGADEDLVSGDYIITYGTAAMNTTLTSGQLGKTTITSEEVSEGWVAPQNGIVWRITVNGNTATIYNVATGKFLNIASSSLEYVDTPVWLTYTSTKDGVNDENKIAFSTSNGKLFYTGSVFQRNSSADNFTLYKLQVYSYLTRTPATHTVTWSVMGSNLPASSDYSGIVEDGDAFEDLSIPDDPSATEVTCADAFVGWATAAITKDGATESDVQWVDEEAIIHSDVTYYAVFAQAEEGEETTLVNFTGNTSSDLTSLDYVSAEGLGSDYAESHAPYQVKLDGTGDYILLSLPSVPTNISIAVKMIGGTSNSSIILQESATADGTFTDVEIMSISGSQNDVVEWTSTETFTQKYIKLYFTKGSNVGLGGLQVQAGGTSYSNYVTSCPDLKHATITFDANGKTLADGSMPADITNAIVGKANTLPSCSATVTGYTFAGWSATSTGEVITEYTPLDEGQTYTMYAKWTPNTVTITWDANGGSVDPASSSYTYDGASVELPTPTTTLEKKFVGWFTAKTGGTQITEIGTTNKPAANVTYYAQWRDIVWTDYLTDCSAPYTWTIWYEDPSDSQWKDAAITEGQAQFTLAKESTFNFKIRKTNDEGENYTYYGPQNTENSYTTSGTQWTLDYINGDIGHDVHVATGAAGVYTINVTNMTGDEPQISVTYPTSYQITFVDNGSDGGSMTNVIHIAAGEDVTLADNAYTKTGYHFKGWVANVAVTIGGSSVSAGTLIADGATIQNINSNIILTAQWETKVTALTISQESDINEIVAGETLQLTLTVTPNGAEYGTDYTWHTSNIATMTVDQNGLVTGVQANTGDYIYVTNNDGVKSNHYVINVKSAACDTWGLHMWNKTTFRDFCFSQVGSTTEWRTQQVTLPSNSDEEKLKVLYAGKDGYYSAQWITCWVPTVGYQQGTCTDGNLYAGQDAKGYFRIFSDSNDPNYFLAFQPVYAVMYGVEGQTWQQVEFTDTETANNFYTDIVTVPEGYNSNVKIYAGTSKASGVNFISGRSSTVMMNTITGLTGSDMAGKAGKFKINDNYCNESNFNLSFIRYYRLHYNLDGGAGTGDYTDKFALPSASAAERTFTLETAPTKEGYTFRGWSVSIGGGAATIKEVGDDVTLTEDAVVTAIWAQNFTVTYDLDGYSTSCSSSTAHYCGETGIVVCDAPEDKTGYTFMGWNTDDIDVVATDYTPGATFTMPCNDVVFTAHYEADSYTITYEGLEGASNTNPATYTIESNITFVAPGARTGYTFTGWTENGNPITGITAGTTGIKTITANWSLNSHSVTFNANGHGTAPGGYANVNYGALVTKPTDPADVDESGDIYSFIGWYKEAGCTNVWNFATDVMPDNDLTLYAKWSGVTYEDYRTHCCTPLPAPTGGVANNITMTTATLSWNAVSGNNGYQVSANQANWVDVLSGTSYNLTGLTAGTPYTYYVRAKGDNDVYCQYGTTAQIEFTTKAALHITYNANGGTGTDVVSGDIEEGTPATVAGNTFIASTGMTFNGWNTQADGEGTAYAVGATINPLNADLTLYAQWIGATFDVTYALNGGTGGCTSTTATYNSEFTICSTIPTNGTNAFTGWSSDVEIGGKSTFQPGETFTMPASNVTLTAQWTASYTVTYVINNVQVSGTSPAGPSYVAQGQSTTLPDFEFSCGLYNQFIGWVSAEVAEQDEKIPCPALVGKAGDSFTPTGNITLYALFGHNAENLGWVKQTTISSGKYLMANENYVMTGFNTASNTSKTNFATVASAANTGSFATKPDGAVELEVIVGTGGTFAMKYGTDYIASTDGNYLNYQAGVSNEWTLLDGNTKINDALETPAAGAIYTASQTRVIYYNSSRFAAYTNASGKQTVYLYKLINEGYYTTSPTCDIPTSVTVTYNKNTVDEVTMCADAELHFTTYPTLTEAYTLCAAADVVHEGYVLRTWNTAANGTGKNYAPGTVFNELGNNLNLYAQWDRVYTVTFHDKYGSAEATATEVTQASLGSTIDVPAAALDDDCITFVGWTSESTVQSGNPVQPTIVIAAGTGTYTPEADMHLYAIYSKEGSALDFAPATEGVRSFYLANTALTAYATETIPTTTTGGKFSSEATTTNATPIFIDYQTSHVGNYKYTIRTANGYLAPADGTNLKSQADPYYWNIVSGSDGGYNITENDNRNRQISYSDPSFGFYTYLTSVKLVPCAASTFWSNPTCAEFVTITFQTVGDITIDWTGSRGTADSYKDLPINTSITQWPTAQYEGWTFAGWSKVDYSNSSKYAGSFAEDTKNGTMQPDQSDGLYANENATLELTANNNYNMYPIFTKVHESTEFDEAIGGDYLIYFKGTGARYKDDYTKFDNEYLRVYATNYTGSAYRSTSSCADAYIFTFVKRTDGNWDIKRGTNYLCNISDNDISEQAGLPDYGWTMEKQSNGSYIIHYLGNTDEKKYIRVLDLGSGEITNNTFKCYSEDQAGSGMYMPVFIGSCVERQYSSEPSNKPTLEMAGAVYTTSTNGQNVRSATGYTIKGSFLKANTEISLTDASGNAITGLSIVGSDGKVIKADANGTLASTTAYVVYNPTETTDGITNRKVYISAVDRNDAAIRSAAPSINNIHLRHLPAKFLIAQKVGDDWYALPNDMTASMSNPAAAKLLSVNEATGTATIYSDVENIYAYTLLAGRASTANMGFNATGTTKTLRSSTTVPETTMGLYATDTWSSTKPAYEFTPATEDLKDYTLTSALQNADLGIADGNWVISGDQTVRFFAIDQQTPVNLTLTGDVVLTSATGIEVYGNQTSNLLTISANYTNVAKLRYTYNDGTSDVAVSNSVFRLNYFGFADQTDYNKADATTANHTINVSSLTGEVDQTFSVSLTPAAANTMYNYTLTIAALDASNNVMEEKQITLKGRSLPEQFVIAMKNTNDNKWYALPNDLAISTSEGSSTKAPLLISVDNTTTPTKALMAPKNTLYKGDGRYEPESHRNAIRFLRADATSNAWITTNSTTSQLYMPNNGADKQQFNLLSSDLSAYTIRQDEDTKKTIAMYGGIIGWYSSSSTKTVYLLPVDASAEDAVFDIVEWFPTKLLIESSQAITTTSVQVGTDEAVVATASTATYGTHLYEVQTGDLTAKAGQAMSVSYTIEATTYAKVVTVPIILSQGTYATSGSAFGGLDAPAKYQYNDLVVRDGATLTVDAATGTHNTFKNVTIYPTSKVVVPAKATGDDTKEVTMTTTTMTLFGGTDEIYDGSEYMLTKYGVPQLVLNGKLEHNETTSGLVYDVRVDKAQYYNFALPYSSKYELVTDNKGGEDFTFWTKIYDGETRAAGNNGWVWYDWDADPWAINIGTGYMFAAQPYSGQNYIIIRHPMGYYNAGEDPYAKNEGGHQSGTAEATKAAVDVYAYPSTYNNNAGWNFIANPFMANFTKDLDGEATGTIQTGMLVEHKVNDKWDGHYDWEAGSMTVRYVTLYNNGTDTYTQLPMSTAVLAPFTGFFVQIAKDGQIVFDISGRTNAAPARMLNEDELPSEMEIFLHAAGQGQKDETVLFLSNGLQRDNAKEFPNEMTKQENAGTLNFYTYGGETKMFANGMSYTDGQTWSNAGLMVAKEGNYTFSVTGADNEHVSHVILRDKYSNTEYDLKHTDAEIYLEAGEVNDRFDVKLVLDEHGVTTELDNVHDNNNPEKFIYNDKMFIRVNGRIYDATGKRVNK